MCALINVADDVLRGTYLRDFDDYPSVKEDIRRWFRDEPFRVGYSGFLPGTSEPDESQDPLIRILQNLASELELECSFERFEWQNFYERLKKRALTTIVDPILSTIERESVIIPTCVLTSARMVFSRDLEGHIRDTYYAALTGHRRIHRAFSPTFFVPFDIAELLRDLRSTTEGFVVRAGFIESDILRRANIRSEKLTQQGREFVESAARRVVDEDKVLFLDETSLSEVRRTIAPEILRELRDSDDANKPYYLFGSPVYSLAGFPLMNTSRFDRLMQRFMRYHALAEDGLIRVGLEAPDTSITHSYGEAGIKLLAPEQLSHRTVSWDFSPTWCNGDSTFFGLQAAPGLPAYDGTQFLPGGSETNKDKASRILDTVFSMGDSGLALFFKLADEGQIDMQEIVRNIDATSAAVFASTLAKEGYAHFEGEAVVADEPIVALSQKMRRKR